MNKFIICGVGGQGIKTCSKILLRTALNKGYNVVGSIEVGMAQRGGSVVSHIKIGGDTCSPHVIKGDADEVISLSYKEAVRNQIYLKYNGLMSIGEIFEEDKTNEKNFFRKDINFKTYNLPEICKDISPIYYNLVMLGIAFSESNYIISDMDIKRTIISEYKKDHLKENIRALEMGIEIKKNYEGISFEKV